MYFFFKIWRNVQNLSEKKHENHEMQKKNILRGKYKKNYQKRSKIAPSLLELYGGHEENIYGSMWCEWMKMWVSKDSKN